MIKISALTSFLGNRCKSLEPMQNNIDKKPASSQNLDAAPKPALKKDVFTAATLPKGMVLTKKQRRVLEHQKQLQSETEGINFQVVKLKFSPEDEEKMSKMNVKERIEYRRKLKEEGKYTILNPEVFNQE